MTVMLNRSLYEKWVFPFTQHNISVKQSIDEVSASAVWLLKSIPQSAYKKSLLIDISKNRINILFLKDGYVRNVRVLRGWDDSPHQACYDKNFFISELKQTMHFFDETAEDSAILLATDEAQLQTVVASWIREYSNSVIYPVGDMVPYSRKEAIPLALYYMFPLPNSFLSLKRLFVCLRLRKCSIDFRDTGRRESSIALHHGVASVLCVFALISVVFLYTVLSFKQRYYDELTRKINSVILMVFPDERRIVDPVLQVQQNCEFLEKAFQRQLVVKKIFDVIAAMPQQVFFVSLDIKKDKSMIIVLQAHDSMAYHLFHERIEKEKISVHIGQLRDAQNAFFEVLYEGT